MEEDVVRGLKMKARFILTDYVCKALAQAVYDELEDGAYAGKIPSCPGPITRQSTP